MELPPAAEWPGAALSGLFCVASSLAIWATAWIRGSKGATHLFFYAVTALPSARSLFLFPGAPRWRERARGHLFKRATFVIER